MAETRILDLIERIGALVRSGVRREAGPHDLHPIHIQALDYLTRANRFSDTPAAVGDYLGLTKGNVSQRLNVLERLRLVRKLADSADGRVVHLKLTNAGIRLLQEIHPPPSWREAVKAMDAQRFSDLERQLAEVLHALVAANDFRTFGQCKTCRFHQRNNNQSFCGLLEVDLSDEDAKKICREHQHCLPA